MLPLAVHYSAMIGWCEDGALAANQALGAALEELLLANRIPSHPDGPIDGDQDS